MVAGMPRKSKEVVSYQLSVISYQKKTVANPWAVALIVDD
jgi:hypothetical protein